MNSGLWVVVVGHGSCAAPPSAMLPLRTDRFWPWDQGKRNQHETSEPSYSTKVNRINGYSTPICSKGYAAAANRSTLLDVNDGLETSPSIQWL